MTYSVQEGPGKTDLQSSLFYCVLIEFTFLSEKGKKITLRVVVTSATAQDKNHDSWLLKMDIKETNFSYFQSLGNLSFCYNSQERTGHFNL